MLVSTYYLNTEQPWRKDPSYSNTAASFRNMLNANGVRITADLLNSAMIVNVDSQDDSKVNSIIKAGAFNAKYTGWQNDQNAKVINQTKPAVPTAPAKPAIPTPVSNIAKDPEKKDDGGFLILAAAFLFGMAMRPKKGGNRRK